MTGHKIQIVGLIRFSVLTPTYYSERFPTLEETARHLFSEQRMDLRFRLFERLCLPSLTNQTDAEFTLIVLTSDQLPKAYRQRLRALLKPFAHIRMRTAGSKEHYRLLKQAYDSVDTDPGVTHRILFRLDDDDAVDRDFIRRTRHLATGLLALHDDPPPTVIAYNRGFYLRRDTGEVFDAIERAPLSAGVSLLAPVGHGTNPYRYVHRKYPQHYNVYSDITVPGFVRTIHGDNKSTPTVMGLTGNMTEPEIDRALSRFGTSVADLRSL